MATVNFSVPDKVKEEFNKYFAGENKSAVLTRFMEAAIDEKKRAVRRAAAVDAILELRKSAPRVSRGKVARIRREQRR